MSERFTGERFVSERTPRDRILRYVVGFVVALVALVGLTLLVRPLIYSVAPPRDDSVYAVAEVGAVAATPVLKDVLLNRSHGLLGERPNGAQVVIRLAISRTLTGEYSVVDAWSPVNDCALAAGADRLTDCKGHSWTPDGAPFASSDPPLERFVVRIDNGALIADLTKPVAP